MPSTEFLDCLKEMYEHNVKELETVQPICPKKAGYINGQIIKYRMYIDLIINIKKHEGKNSS